MLKSFADYIQRHDLFHPATPLLVACSGGKDSMALLHLLLKGAYKNISVGHCNFQLRGDDALADESFVQEFCLQHQIPFYSIRFNTAEYAKEKGISIQMAARDLRYQWLETCRKACGAHLIVTAHHADDQVETILQHLIQGSGLKGMRGMLPKNGKIVRPLLSIPLAEILQWIEKEKITYREDSSNAKDDYTRNYIRHHILPPALQLNPAFISSAMATTERLNESHWLMEESIGRIRRKCLHPWKNGHQLLTTYILSHPACSTIFYELLSPFGFTGAQVQEMLQTLNGHKSNSHSGQKFISDEFYILTDKKSLYILPQHDEKTPLLQWEKWPNQLIFNEYKVTVRLQPIAEFNLKTAERYACLDADKIEFPIRMRYAENADYFYPMGMSKPKTPGKSGKKKLSKYFKDEKISLAARQFTPLLFSGDKLMWVLGHRIDERFKVTESTRNVAVLVITKPLSGS